MVIVFVVDVVRLQFLIDPFRTCEHEFIDVLIERNDHAVDAFQSGTNEMKVVQSRERGGSRGKSERMEAAKGTVDLRVNVRREQQPQMIHVVGDLIFQHWSDDRSPTCQHGSTLCNGAVDDFRYPFLQCVSTDGWNILGILIEHESIGFTEHGRTKQVVGMRSERCLWM